ncbi:hypothetical protein BOTBODRAFT_51386 [Botryobasidium botryosum FD-172 SS1]|uniref:Uncharacterized protein n=1 Tax=Botryobasidium botryosum (strain FD-172 SS1) TaxID=930990 RepID=A0A067MWA0_BOTB1|nr:hypothetical protein BOTBODRAFT_51386 [Botryobasidium botryosum FD-172 SS1]
MPHNEATQDRQETIPTQDIEYEYEIPEPGERARARGPAPGSVQGPKTTNGGVKGGGGAQGGGSTAKPHCDIQEDHGEE